MTVSLRHLYLIFVLAMLVAFTIHAQAFDMFGTKPPRTGSVRNNYVNSLDSNGDLRPTTNCVLCGWNMACGDLGQKLPNGITLRQACANATTNLEYAVKNCSSHLTYAESIYASDWKLLKAGWKKGNLNYSDVSGIAANVTVLGKTSLPTGKYMSVIAVPDYEQYKKLAIASGTKPTVAPIVPTDEVMSLVRGAHRDEQEEMRECVEDVNKQIIKRHNKVTEEEFRAAVKNSEAKEVYLEQIQKSFGLSEKDYSHSRAVELRAKCDTASTPPPSSVDER